MNDTLPIEKNVEAPSSELVFVGEVTEIKINRLPKPSNKHWIVTISVHKVQVGEFGKDTFSFRIHSPARAGIEVGKEYTVKAKWIGSGYEVEESNITGTH